MKRKFIKVAYYFMFIGLIIHSGCSKKLMEGFNPDRALVQYDTTKFDWYFTEGTKQKLLGNTGQALKYMEECISINPESDATYYQLAQIMLNNGNIASGKKYIRKAAELDPENLWYQVTLASLYYQQHNIDSAIICYERAVKMFPERESLQISLANLYSEEKRFDRARDILERLDQKYGVNENTTVSLVRTLIAEKKYREGRLKVEQLLEQDPENIMYNGMMAEIYNYEGNSDKAMDVYRSLVQNNPDDPGVQLSLCNFLAEEKDYEGLMNILDTVVINDRITREDKITLLVGLFETDEIVREYGPHLEFIVGTMEQQYEDDNLVNLLMPELLEKEGKLREATLRLESVIDKHQENYMAWEKLLLLYYNMKEFSKLEVKARACTMLFDRSVMAKILYAAGAMENENYGIALDELRKADMIAGSNKDMQLQILTMRADTFYRMKNYEQAFVTFDDALKINNTDLTILNNYAYYLAEQNMKLKEAETMAKKVIETERNNTTFLDTYAWVLFKRGKTREAAKIMEKIIASGEKDDAEWYEHYGYILKKMGKCREAVEKWEKALYIDNSKSKLKEEITNCKGKN